MKRDQGGKRRISVSESVFQPAASPTVNCTKKILGGLISTPAEEVSIYGQFLQKTIKDFIVSVS